jgi:hypothetical protein
MDIVTPVLLLLGGILASSSLIIAKKPDAKGLIDKLTPYQAGLGVVLLVLGIWNFITYLGFLMHPFGWALAGITMWAMIASLILLGFLFGMPQIAKWIPGESSAEQTALELAKKLVPYQTPLGVLAIVSALLALLIRFHFLKP